jgi:hypothetical protein
MVTGSADCRFSSPLKRDGTSQRQRMLAALRPSYARIDERELGDFLVQARRYATLLRYYSKDNTPGGNWAEFIENDISSLVALVGDTDSQSIRKQFEERKAKAQAVSESDWPAAYAALYPPIVDLAEYFDRWYRLSVVGLSLRSTTERLIRSVLTDALRSVLAHGQRASLVNPPLPVAAVDPARFSRVWALDDPVDPDQTLFPSGSSAISAEREEAVHRLGLVFDRFYEALLVVVGRAPSFLQETLDYPEHQPHMALFLAFLRLFQHAREHLNSLTAAHLDFYLKEVLRLAPRPETPDSAHIVFELAKNFSQHRIEKGTALRAEKDAKGHDRFYVTESELVVHRARLDVVHGLKTVFVDKDPETGEVRAIHAAPDADSADGLGADTENAGGKWETFGGTNMPHARVGFAIASPMFLLAEGTRTIHLSIHAKSADLLGGDTLAKAQERIVEKIEVHASGEEEWLPVSVKEAQLLPANAPSILSFTLELGPELGPVVPYDAGVLGEEFSTKHPVVRFVLGGEDLSSITVDYSDSVASYPHGALVRHQGRIYEARVGITEAGFQPSSHPEVWKVIESSYPYKYLRRIDVESLSLGVSVSGLKSLILENDVGLLDPAKPFHPFGPVPKAGSRFLIGSREVFQKRVTELTLRVDWAGLPAQNFKQHYSSYQSITGNEYFTAAFEVLKDGQWTKLQNYDHVALFQPTGDGQAPGTSSAFTITLGNQLPQASGALEFRRFDASLRRGFLQAKLNQSFLHEMYPGLLAAAAKPDGTAPPAPYTPLVGSLTLHYDAGEEVIDPVARSEDGLEQVFQLGPFGHREIQDGDRKLVPQFDVTVGGADGSAGKDTCEGTLFLGIAGLSPPRALSLLFQVAEGSEDPSQSPAPLVWSYLSAGSWVDFRPAEIVSDGTRGLLTSGVLTFSMPRTMTEGDGLLPRGLHWIKGSVLEATAGIPKLVAVHPHAVAARFNNQGNDSSHLAQALPAGIITKLKSRDAAIKNVLQPYGSFGGRLKESNESFYLRVSERLRHKRRAVTLFDYERLVLEEFPEVYKVKCIGHAYGSSEHAPGRVKLVVVPNLRNRNAVDPLRPQLSRNKLESIREYLQRLASDFVKIEVSNPDYEEVQVRFKVRLHPGRDEGFYAAELEQDVIRFLSPWLYDVAADMTFGGRVHRSSILEHIEKREYVDFVRDFEMDHCVRGRVRANVEEAVASSSSAALVAAKHHGVSTDLSSCADFGRERRGCDEEVTAGRPAVKPPGEIPPGVLRYLGNTGARELHDLLNLHPMCQVDEIAIDRRFYFKSTRDAVVMGYDFCDYCFPEGMSKR